jgi:alcohol dehydrogenase class IV
MSYASLVSGIALSNAKLGLVHGIAGPLGGRKPISHGAICARLLPEVLDFNLSRMSGDRPNELARLIIGASGARAGNAITRIRELVKSAGIPSLAAGGLREEDLPSLSEQSLRSGSTKGNPVQVTMQDIQSIIRAAMY